MLKVLIVIPSVSKKWGGTTTSLLNFYRGLTRFEDINLKVASAFLEEERLDIDQGVINNENFFLFPIENKAWRHSKELIMYLKGNIHSYDLIWIHGLWTSMTYYASKYAKRSNIPYILTPHGMFEPDALQRKALKKKIYWSLIEKKVFKNASIIHCINHAEELQILKYSSSETFVLPNGVVVDNFISKDYEALDHIGFVGRLHEKKGLNLLLKALPKFPRLKLLIAGSGTKEYEDYLYQLVDELDIKTKVEFLGFANDKMKMELFNKVAFVVVPSYTEVLTYVALESIAHSTPVLITKACNFDDIEKFKAGIVIKDNTPSTIEEGITKMLRQDLKKMSENAYKLAKEKYSIKEVSKNMHHKILEICR